MEVDMILNKNPVISGSMAATVHPHTVNQLCLHLNMWQNIFLLFVYTYDSSSRYNVALLILLVVHVESYKQQKVNVKYWVVQYARYNGVFIVFILAMSEINPFFLLSMKVFRFWKMHYCSIYVDIASGFSHVRQVSEAMLSVWQPISLSTEKLRFTYWINSRFFISIS